MIARFFAAIALYVGEGGFAIDRGSRFPSRF
jgi:hypothetical protein